MPTNACRVSEIRGKKHFDRVRPLRLPSKDAPRDAGSDARITRSVTCRRQRPERGPAQRRSEAALSHQPDEARDTHDRAQAEQPAPTANESGARERSAN
jgi:hypothetical protein